MLVATFDASTGWEGKTITYDDGVFVLGGHGRISAADVMTYDGQGHISWAYEGLREWVQQIAASGADAVPAPQTQVQVQVLSPPGIGIAGFVCALLGIPFLGMILSWAGYSQARREGLPTGLCVAGIVIGALSTAFAVFVIIAIILAAVAGQASYPSG